MKNLTKSSLIILWSFLWVLFYGYYSAKTVKTVSSPAASASPAVKASEETPFPTKSVPGLYVNKSPVFSVSYPADWVEKTPNEPGCVFRVSMKEGFPSLRIYVLQTTGTSKTPPIFTLKP